METTIKHQFNPALNLSALSWPATRLGEAIEHLAQRARLVAPLSVDMPHPPANLETAEAATVARWIETLAGCMGVEAEPVQTRYAEAGRVVQNAGPALIRLPDSLWAGEGHFLAVLKGGWRRVTLLGPDGTVQRVPTEAIREVWCAFWDAPHRAAIEQFLTRIGVASHRRARARQAILNEQLGSLPLVGCWLLRLSPGAHFWQQAKGSHLPRAALRFFGGQVAEQLLTLAAWALLGQRILAGQLESPWLMGGMLLLVTAGAAAVWTSLAESQVAIGMGRLFKQRLLHGALQLEPEDIRDQGAGQFLGRVMASEAVEVLALSGGINAATAVIQLGLATAVLALGAGAWPHALLLLGWVGVSGVLGWTYWRRGQAWSETHLAMTHDLVEQMVGHRTRLAQDDRAHWHDAEDAALNRYLLLSARMDRTVSQLLAALPRGWMVVGLGGLALAFAGPPPAVSQIAISLGGILFALQALMRLTASAPGIIEMALAWRQVRPLFHAAASPGSPLSRVILPDAAAPFTEARTNVLTARDLRFRYRDSGRLILNGCDVRIRHGDHLLLEGASGSGKSTLAAILAGLRPPESGVLLLAGMDPHTLGPTAWRRRVLIAPQFHDNHVFTGTFAFNLLMGRDWPPHPDDLAEAETICRELGLGALLDRMPAGIQQMVGDSGWQLSHGERSRLYVARALLQRPEVLICDESFGALDPENLTLALTCVLQRAPTLMVIAHP